MTAARRKEQPKEAPLPTVFVVDDDAAVRDAMQWLIESVGLSVRVFPSAPEFLDAYDTRMPGCLLLDMRMPGMSGLALQQQLVERGINLPVIVITGHGDVQMAVQAMKLGAVEFIEKPFSDDLLLDRIQQAVQYDAQRRQADAHHREARALVDKLSAREREVLEELLKGKANKEVAVALNISVKTVEVHRAHINEKLGVHSVVALVRTALDGLEGSDQSPPATFAPPAESRAPDGGVPHSRKRSRPH